MNEQLNLTNDRKELEEFQHITDVGIVARILMAPTFDDRTQKIPLMDTIIEKVSSPKTINAFRCCGTIHVNVLAAFIACFELALLSYHIIWVLCLFAMTSFSLFTVLAGASINVKVTLVGDLFAAINTNALSPTSKATLVSSFLHTVLITAFFVYLIISLINLWCFGVLLDCYRSVSCQSKMSTSPAASPPNSHSIHNLPNLAPRSKPNGGALPLHIINGTDF
ncbi:hypothetical protein WR25_21054 [Diploscapter pachys]|uniref:Uncharacterized protein n=1 Tax=Diploscapter pachys TaxID=2018661 RepID=A0A2A2KS05_9BILA|nr:hypothetical protein WR25_21054 [Diploscapter pachys]